MLCTLRFIHHHDPPSPAILPPADFFRALSAAGVSRRRSAVPSAQRGSQAWFVQPAAEELSVLLAAVGSSGAAAVDEQQSLAAERCWAKADRYYFASMARLQRLWEVRCCTAGPLKRWWCGRFLLWEVLRGSTGDKERS